MKRVVLLFSLLLVVSASSVFAQTLNDYVLSVKGDTLVVKDDYDFGAFNTLRNIIKADTINVPAGRVYMLKKNGYYSLQNNPTSAVTKRKVVITGEDKRSVKTNQDGTSAPPVISGASGEGGINTATGITSAFDVEVKNLSFESTNPANLQIGWNYFTANAGCKLVLDNVVGEHSLWIMAQPQKGASLFLKNSYFINAVGHQCRRNGGVVDNQQNADTLWVENCTHVNHQGIGYKFREATPVKRAVFNHNTWIDCPGHIIMSVGSNANISFTNNIIVNSHLYPMPVGLKTYDAGESDRDGQAMSIINVYPTDTTFIRMGAKYYVDRNLIYWSPIFDDLVSTISSKKINGISNWQDAKVSMNPRTQAAFDDNSKYPLLQEYNWTKGKLPTFKKTGKLLTTAYLQSLKDFAIKTVDSTSTAMLPMWREVNTDLVANWVYVDWPTPIDLAYTDTDLMKAGHAGFPLGDLDWFPTQKASWLAQRSAEYKGIVTALDGGKQYTGTGIEKISELPTGYTLGQNYPNPFNPTTNINFSIPKAANVTLKVYNSLGQIVSTLVNETKSAGSYKVDFNASKLASGIYFYTINAGDFSQTKKMMLVK